MCFFVHKPVADEENEGANYKKAHDIKIGFQMRIFIFYVKHWDTQNSNNKYI